MNTTCRLVLTLLLCAFSFSNLFGQEPIVKKDAAKEPAKVTAAKASLAKMQSFLKGGQWDDLMVHLSELGKDSLAIEVCYSLAVSNEISEGGMEGLPPGLDAFVENVEAVKKKYELDKISKLIFNGKTKAALKELDATGRKWEIVDAVWKAQSGSPFHVHPAYGDVVAFDVEGESVFLDVEMKPISKPANGKSAMIQMDGPPQVIRLKQVDGKWKYDGIDEERTMKRMEKFMKEMGGKGMGMGMEMEAPKLLDDPSFTGESFDGKSVSLADYKGKIVVLDFWGTWCGPCVAAMPSMKLIREAFGKHGVEIIGIAVDKKSDVASFCKENKISWPNVVDPEGKLADKFGVAAFPTLMVIDQQGKHVLSDIEKKPLVDLLIKNLKLDAKEFKELKKKLAKPEMDSPEVDESIQTDT